MNDRKKRNFGTIKIMRVDTDAEGNETYFPYTDPDEEMPPLDTTTIAERWIKEIAKEGETYVVVRLVKRLSVKTVTRQELKLETEEL